GARQLARRLGQKRRFADAGVAADEQHRAAHESAAGDPVKLEHAGGQARGVLALAGETFQGEQPSLPLGADRDRHRRRAGYVFLGERVPFAAGGALALPAIIGSAAVLADERERVLGHGGFVRRRNRERTLSHSMEWRPAMLSMFAPNIISGA